MSRKFLCSSAAALAITGALYSSPAYCEESSNTDSDSFYETMISVYHVREDEDFFGGKNSTNFRLQPTWTMGNVVFETDFVIGKTAQRLSPVRDKIVKALESQAAFNDDVATRKKIRDKFHDNTNDRMRFYRNFTRATYENKAKNYKVIIGDAPANVTFGNMQGISGAGISFVRSASMFDRKAQSVLNSQSCITILRPSLVEVIQCGCTIQATPFAPGVYSLSDFVPEAGLHNIEITITDDFQHSYTYKVDTHSDKNPLPADTDEFELRAFLPHVFDPMDPFVRKYADYLVFSGVYRYGYTEDVTLNFNTQAFSQGVKAETGYSYATKYGLFSQAFGASFGNKYGSRNAVSAQFFYSTPDLPIGKITVSAGVVTKGYIDLGVSDDEDEIYERIYNTFKAPADAAYVSPFSSTTAKTLSVKYVPCEIIKNVGLCFLYKQKWLHQYMKYSYDISLTWKKDKYAFVSGIGITTVNDDRDYVNKKILKETDLQRRFYLGVNLMLCSQLKLTSSYDYDDNRSFYNSLEYKPAAVKGLTITLDSTLYNGCGEYRAHGGKVKYECKYGDIRVDHQITMRHKPGVHNNRERIFLNTYLRNNEFVKKYKRSYITYMSKDDLKPTK